MKKQVQTAVVVAVVVLLSWVANAGPAAITLKAGTLGLGADLTMNLGAKLNARIGLNGFTYEESMDMDEAVLEGELAWQTIPILLDWHPMGSGFRISAGAVINNNEVSLSAEPTESFELEDTEYAIERLDGKVTFDGMAPYIGIGYGDAVGEDGRWHFACDFGVMFHGEPEVTAEATASNPNIQALLNADLETEVAELEEDLSAFNIYPVISLGFSFSF